MSLLSQLTDLIEDPTVAGIHRSTHYANTLPTVTPPAGLLTSTLHGEFALPDGREAVVIESWGSQASRAEAAAERLADAVNLPRVRFLDPDGNVLTTSLQLSHRHADVTWRLARHELEAAGVPFLDLQQATIQDAALLVRWWPTAVLMGWWHSQPLATTAGKADKKLNNAKKALNGDMELVEMTLGYAPLGPDARSARLVTSEIAAFGVHRRHRRPARIDNLFGTVSQRESQPGAGTVKMSTLGLGTIPPPSDDSKTVIDVTYEQIRGSWWLSLSGLRRFGFATPDPIRTQVLLAALALLLHDEAQHDSYLRAGTELVITSQSTEVWQHHHQPAALEIPERDELIALVRELGAEAGWEGTVDITITPGSPLGRVIAQVNELPSAAGE